MSEVTKPLLLNETFTEKLDTQNILLAGILAAQGGSIKPTAWSDVQALVRAGLASQVFHIGDQLTCYKDTTLLTWDVIGIDHDTPVDSQYTHSMTLQLHDCLTSLQYDEREALYYASTALSAGTYYFTVGVQAWYTGDVGKSFQFTLTEDVPAGGQIVIGNTYNTTYEGATVKTYSSGSSTTAIESTTLTEGSEGTSLGTTAITTGDNLNCYQRALLGSNNWAESALRQYLNSDAAAGSVWTPQTNFDRPPSWVSSTAGFMNGLDDDFLAVLGVPEKITARNTVCDNGGSDTTEDLFWLLSRREVYAGYEVSGVDEGEPYPYYADYSDLSAAGTGTDSNRIKYRNGSKQYWWLRTPNASNGYIVRNITTTGNLYTNYAYSSSGVAPACCII